MPRSRSAITASSAIGPLPVTSARSTPCSSPLAGRCARALPMRRRAFSGVHSDSTSGPIVASSGGTGIRFSSRSTICSARKPCRPTMPRSRILPVKHRSAWPTSQAGHPGSRAARSARPGRRRAANARPDRRAARVRPPRGPRSGSRRPPAARARRRSRGSSRVGRCRTRRRAGSARAPRHHAASVGSGSSASHARPAPGRVTIARISC